MRWDQLRDLGLGRATIGRWVHDGYLHPVLPRVYAVGHLPSSIESHLSAALLYAGPGAALSHATALWWWGLLDHAPELIEVSTPRRVRSRDRVRIHGRRALQRVTRKDLPVTTPAQAIADFAAVALPSRLRFVLANADYHDLLDLDSLDALCCQGQRGTVALREALERHRPELAHARSELERALLSLCEEHGLPPPECNVHVHGWLVDAVWEDRKVIVEVDGYGAHRTRAQLEQDHQRDLELRSHGYIVLRYTWRQLTATPLLVIAELRRYL